MRKKHLSKKIILTLICLILEVLILITGGTLAIYMSQDHQRSVVRNRDNETIRFSSDKLYRVMNSGALPQKYYCPMEKDKTTMDFQVCNYDQVKNTLFNEKRIEYTITFQVTNGTDGFDYKISHGSNSEIVRTGESVSFTDSLAGGRRSTNSYYFTFDQDDFNKVELEVTVTPTDTTLTQNRILNGILIPIEYATTQGVNIKYEFTDSTRGYPSEFDAYNLAVSISGGSGTVLITWNSAELDIDPFFKESKSVSTDENNYTTIEVSMNSEDATGTYLIQFYNHNTIKPEWPEWSALPIKVSLDQSST